jgi:hypothetical protein
MYKMMIPVMCIIILFYLTKKFLVHTKNSEHEKALIHSFLKTTGTVGRRNFLNNIFLILTEINRQPTKQSAYLIGCVGGSSVMAMSLAALYETSEFSAASFLSLPVANSARYRW